MFCADSANGRARENHADFLGFFRLAEKCVFCAKRSLTSKRGAHRNRAFPPGPERLGPHTTGFGFAWAGIKELPRKRALCAVLFDIVILEKGNAGGGVLRASE
ncbi:hypothetical protein ATE48_17140 [Candidatus Viadribacter manganicus]|uniref:Uncharacterized protein n=1 Tax=Candidatus Viadribacter manganicus TaxID=1759059 RepID=A0A1B1ALU6_9PROT|nr:hypothetical protein ATE48_17140 [Candidatus Viadribacter manganicus]